MPRRYLLFIALSLGMVVLDQGTKYLAVEHLTAHFDKTEGFLADVGALYADPPPVQGGFHFQPRGQVEVIPGYLRLRYAENPGAAWGLFRTVPQPYRAWVFHLVSIGAVVLITFYFRKLSGRPEEKWALIGLPLILAGALGNYVDRVARSFVIDFIEMHWRDQAYWPSYNVADMCIVAGVIALVLDSVVRRTTR